LVFKGSESSPFHPLRYPRFRRLWIANTASSAGDAVVGLARVVAVYEVAGSARGIGIVLAAALIPNLAFLLAGGVWADRLPRQLVMVASDAVRGIAHLTLAVLLLTGRAQLWQFAALAVVYGTANAFFNPAARGLVPDTLPTEHLTEANSLMEMTRHTLALLGPAIAGIAIALIGPAWLFAADAASFAISAVCLVGVRTPAVEERDTSFAHELVEGWREVVSRGWIWASIVYYGFWNLAVATYVVLGPVVAARSWGGPERWAIVTTGMAIGSIVGAYVAGRLRPARPLVAGYSALYVCATVPLALARPVSPFVVAACGAATLGAIRFSNVFWYSTLQEHVPRARLSRVSAWDDLGSLVFMPVGFIVAGVVAGSIGTRATLLLATALFVTATTAILAVPSVRAVGRSEAGSEEPASHAA
jgi:MFS family permease